jgi:hypothetical protein
VVLDGVDISVREGELRSLVVRAAATGDHIRAGIIKPIRHDHR